MQQKKWVLGSTAALARIQKGSRCMDVCNGLLICVWCWMSLITVLPPAKLATGAAQDQAARAE